MSYKSYFSHSVSRFCALFCTPTPLQLSPAILIYIHGSYKYNSFRYFSMAVSLSVRSSRLCCKIFVLKYFRRMSTLQKFFNTKISYNEYFPIYRTRSLQSPNISLSTMMQSWSALSPTSIATHWNTVPLPKSSLLCHNAPKWKVKLWQWLYKLKELNAPHWFTV